MDSLQTSKTKTKTFTFAQHLIAFKERWHPLSCLIFAAVLWARNEAPMHKMIAQSVSASKKGGGAGTQGSQAFCPKPFIAVSQPCVGWPCPPPPTSPASPGRLTMPFNGISFTQPCWGGWWISTSFQTLHPELALLHFPTSACCQHLSWSFPSIPSPAPSARV